MIKNAREAPFPVSFLTYDLSSVAVSIIYNVLKLGTLINVILWNGGLFIMLTSLAWD